MGGRGSNINAAWRRVFQPIGGGGIPGVGMGAGGNAQPPNVSPGKPVPAVTIAQLQAMNGTEFADYLNGLKSTPIDKNIYYNSDWDTQRLIANMPELNKAPKVVDPAAFANLPGETYFRTVNATGKETALDICARTMSSDVTTIGEGVMGDGFYFSASIGGSQIYGSTRNNLTRTATMAAKLNSDAKVVNVTSLESMLAKESPKVRNAVKNMRSGGYWAGDSGLSAYALWKGYNVVERGSNRTLNVIDRSVATWSGQVVPKT